MHLPQTTAVTTRRAILSLFTFLAIVILASDPLGWFRGLAKRESVPPVIAETKSEPAQREAISKSYGKLPLSFEANRGQFDDRVCFKARGLNYALFLTGNEAVFALRSEKKDESSGEVEVLRMKLLGARSNANVSGSGELPGKVNYFIGNDARKWRKNILTYSTVTYRNVYDGIDLVYHGNQQQLEYDFVIAPGASPQRIKIAFKAAKKIAIDGEGNLVLSTAVGDVRQQKPIAYQVINGVRHEVPVKYKLRGKQVGFQTGSYDKSYPLTIDPVLIYSTYLGGSSSEQGLAIAVDSAGNAYLSGNTFSTDFPVANAFQGTKADAFSNDAFVVKLTPAGTLAYATYLGGNLDDNALGIAVDAQGSAYVAGGTGGTFPVTAGVIQETKDGSADVFVTKLSPDGSSLSYSTLLGGDNIDLALGVTVDTSGRAYVIGRTDSTRFKTFTFSTPRNGSPAYKSTNNAGQWSPIPTGLTASMVSGLTIDPSNSNTLYAAANYGVFKSIDAGANWSVTGQASPATAPFPSNVVAVDPTNSANVFVGSLIGIYKSTDGGASYTQKLNIFNVFALAIDPTNPNIMYAGGGSTNPFKSTNGGDSWVQISSGITGGSVTVNDIVIDPTNTSIVYIGTSRGVFKSTNGGGNWVLLNTPFVTVRSLAMDSANPLTLYAGVSAAFDAMYKTTDGGATWAVSSTGLTYVSSTGATQVPLVNTIAVDPVTPATVYAATLNGGLYKSTNAGANWSQSNSGFPNITALDVVIDRNNPANVYAGAGIGFDVFAARLNSTASALEYFFNFGGHENDEARGVAVDTDNTAYVVGLTQSNNFPTLAAFQSVSGGMSDAFITKINAAGSGFVYSTYLGGTVGESARGIAVRNGTAYIGGTTDSNNFPLVNSLKPASPNFESDAFVTKLHSSGSSLEYSTRLGGTGIGGETCFGLALDSTGAVYVTGLTGSDDFPVLNAPQTTRSGNVDAFVTKLDGAVPALVYSTYLGGTGADQANGIVVDAVGNALVIGTTSSSNFPRASALDSTLGGTADAFVSKLGTSADLSIVKTDSRDPVMVHNPLSYTLKVTNNGPSPSSGVTATDVLPAGLTFGSANSTQGSCAFNSGTVTCNLGALAVAASATITIAVTPTSVTTISNTAIVTGNEPDDTPGNNSDTEATKIAALPSINGHVRDGGANGVAGVLITLSGSQSATTQTDAGGFYQFAELPAGGNFTVTPSKAEVSFDPESQTFNNLNADQTADFLATACTYSIAPTSQSFGAAGGTGTINVTTLHGCPWTAVSSDSWITINSGSSGAGNGVVGFTVNVANAPRAGHITVAGKNFPIYQEFNSCGTPSFSVANYNVGSSRNAVRVADLNSDGLLDVLFANVRGSTAGGAAILLNAGSGNFTTSDLETNIGDVDGFVVADLNSDNRPDIAVTNFNSLFVRMFFNNGSGGFGQSQLDAPLGLQPTQGLFASDLNNDGKTDLLVSAFNTNKIQVLLGNGSGGFSQTNLTITISFSLVGVADFNADGKQDLLLSGPDSNQSIEVRLGDGTGGFGAPIGATGFSGIFSPAFGDFNGDGKLDIGGVSAIPPGPFGATPAIVVLAGDGTGHFTLASSFTVERGSGLTTADFNADGKLDVAFTASENFLTILLGNGTGGLGSPLTITTVSDNFGAGNGGIVAADLLGDAKPDLAVANYNHASSILRNTCAAAPSISGRITDTRTFNGIAGVDITLGPLQVINTTTDSNGNYFIGNLSAGADYDVIPSKANFRFSPSSIHISNLTGSQVANFVGTPITVNFTQGHYLVEEFTPNVQINVIRSGDLSGTTTVEYSTVNGTASDRSDFTAAAGTLRFAAGESVKSFNVLFTDDALVEGFESLRLKLSNPTGAILGLGMTDVLMEIRDNDSNPSAPNPIGNSVFFVRQHYHDFLNREPDAGGLSFWVDQIESCGSDVGCREVRRINVSAAFFLAIEFQETGYFAYRVYKAAYGDTTSPNVSGTVPIIRFQEFLPDSQQIGFGVQVGIGDWQQKLDDNKNAYVLQFVQTPRFITAFPLSMTADQFVTKLDQNAGGVLSADEKAQLIAMLTTPADSTQRAAVLRLVAEDNDLRQRELNRAFVLMQFYGYLRRNPDDPQDTDFRGWKFWLDKLNQFNGNFVEAEMVKSFLVSGEYRQRFGTP